MKNPLKYATEVSIRTIDKLEKDTIGTEKAKAIAYNVSNIIKAEIAKIKKGKNI